MPAQSKRLKLSTPIKLPMPHSTRSILDLRFHCVLPPGSDFGDTPSPPMKNPHLGAAVILGGISFWLVAALRWPIFFPITVVVIGTVVVYFILVDALSSED